MKSSEELLEAGGSNPALIEKIFDAARYNVICATGINPPNLQGIWGATMTPPWSGDYTLMEICRLSFPIICRLISGADVATV